ncbi:MAG: FISUMP domain-containing protein [Bacteroidota bacterium]|nr:FISUMP domain-containing protein [Bacteroidota bacterium]
MNKIKIILLCLLPLLTIQGQQSAEHRGKKIYIDKTKIDLASWLSFHNWTLNFKGYNHSLSILPDSNGVSSEVWKFIKYPSPIYNRNIVESTVMNIGFYPDNSFILEQPITGLNQKQINEFCRWQSNDIYRNKRTYRIPTYDDYLLNFDNSVFRKDKYPNIAEICLKDNRLLVIRLDLKSKIIQIIDSISNTHKPVLNYGVRLVADETANGVFNGDNCCQDGRLEMDKTDSTADRRFGLFTDERDGKTYRTIKIGKHTWMAENLAYIPNLKKGFWEFHKSLNYSYLFGVFYDWETAKLACPKGWHLPSKADYEDLVNLYPNTFDAYRDLIISGSSGFSIVYAGNENFTSFWTSTECDKNLSIGITFGGSFSRNKDVKFAKGRKNFNLSVRCLKDE